MARSANQHRRAVEFTEVQQVYVSSKNFHLPKDFSRKLAPKWLGPYQVITKISPVAYRIALLPHYQKIHNVFHASLLKPHHGDMPPTEEPIYEDSEAEEYEVEKIINSRTHHGKP